MRMRWSSNPITDILDFFFLRNAWVESTFEKQENGRWHGRIEYACGIVEEVWGDSEKEARFEASYHEMRALRVAYSMVWYRRWWTLRQRERFAPGSSYKPKKRRK